MPSDSFVVSGVAVLSHIGIVAAAVGIGAAVIVGIGDSVICAGVASGVAVGVREGVTGIF